MSPPQSASGDLHIAVMAFPFGTHAAPLIWSLRDNLRTHLPKGFVEKTRDIGMVVPWAPQKEILQHDSVGVFVSHGGWNSVVESIAGGKPLICRPIFADQMINARVVEEVWEIGIGVENGVVTKNGLLGNLEKILSQDDGKRMRARIGEYKEKGMKAVGENGSSTKNFKKLVELLSWNEA